jgi:hypothetical protein
MVSIPGEVTITKFPVVKEQMPVTCVGIVNDANTALAKTISNMGKIGIQRCFCLFVGKKYYYLFFIFFPAIWMRNLNSFKADKLHIAFKDNSLRSPLNGKVFKEFL